MTAIFMPSRFLAYCLVQEGARKADAGDWHAAAAAYFAGLRFAADVRLNNLLGALIGIDIARMGLAGIAKLISEPDREANSILPILERGLAEFAPYVLSVGEGPRVERLELLSMLEEEAQQYAAAGQGRLGFLIPWRAVTAYRVAQADGLLRRAEGTASIENDAERLRLANAVNAEAAGSWSPTLRTVGPSDWLRVRENADELQERYRMVQAAVRLEGWHSLHGEYPGDISSLDLPFDIDKLQYELRAERQGYRLQSVAVRRSVAGLVLDRRPRPPSSLGASEDAHPSGSARRNGLEELGPRARLPNGRRHVDGSRRGEI